MDIAALVRTLGGVTQVADKLGLTTQAVSNWLRYGRLPAKREAEVLALVLEYERRSGQKIDWRPGGWTGDATFGELRASAQASRTAAQQLRRELVAIRGSTEELWRVVDAIQREVVRTCRCREKTPEGV